ncbi:MULTISPECIES: hypothetical protein [unclassified Vibrio]|uniref:hypothetical protein n=1 Tax=unclassified Vibrio TaxID=2614977 RepID=UPI0020751111|nr:MULTISPECIES: hypothetical protein [unclassified Vibrio]MDK9779237.1 hypothetical protein [Vibrio sp. D401a]MDK9806989.1 hypothetical protein [Vibrio sp. D406a]USD48773.1 hypothetical protein J4N37_09040 [Vibrio sp. SCSIO 43153]
MNEVYFKGHITDSFFFKPSQLYDENRKILKDLSHIEKGELYFIVERGRVRISPKSMSMTRDGYITFDLVGDSGHIATPTIESSRLFIDLGNKFKEIYGSWSKLQQYVVKVDSKSEYDLLQRQGSSLPKIGVSLVPEKQNKKNFVIKLYTPDGQVNDMEFQLHSIISEYELETFDFPKIVYIGKSSNLEDRIYKHEKIQQALACCDDDSDIYLYAFQFDCEKIIKECINGVNYLRSGDVDDITRDDRRTIVEIGLINYFKPQLNVHYIGDDLTNIEVINNVLLDKFTHICVELIFDPGVFWKFGTQSVACSYEHMHIIKI